MIKSAKPCKKRKLGQNLSAFSLIYSVSAFDDKILLQQKPKNFKTKSPLPLMIKPAKSFLKVIEIYWNLLYSTGKNRGNGHLLMDKFLL